MTERLTYNDDELPINSYGVEYDQEMYLSNSRYSKFVDDKIKEIIEAINTANRNLAIQHKKQNKAEQDNTKSKQKQKKNKSGRKSKRKRKRKRKIKTRKKRRRKK